MNQDAIKLWLDKKKNLGFAQHVLLGAVALLAGIVVLFLTFWFTYAIIWFGWHGVTAVSELIFSKKLHLSHAMRLAGSGSFVVLLFIQHFRTNPWYWGEYANRDYSSVRFVRGHGSTTGGLMMMLAYPGASANMVADIFLSGPRLVVGSFDLVRKGFCWKRLDENGCAELLVFLSGQDHAVSYDDLKNAGWEPWLDQLRYIGGVQILQKGLILSEELRGELNGLN